MTFRSKIGSYIAVSCAGLLLSVGTFAQQPTQDKKDEQSRERKGANQTLTGCLAKGDTAGQYSFTDATGQKKTVMPAAGVDLDKHANHTVKLTGTISDDGQTLTATKVEHVSATCEAAK